MENQKLDLENLHITRKEWENFLEEAPALYED